VAGAVSFVGYLTYSTVYLLLQDGAWVAPIPIYLEQCLLPVYIGGAVTGYWGALRRVGSAAGRFAAVLVRLARRSTLGGVRTLAAYSDAARRWRRAGSAMILAGLLMGAIIPAKVIRYAMKDAKQNAEMFSNPWPDEPEFVKFLVDNVGLKIGQQFRGSIYLRSAAAATGHLWRELM